MQLQFKCYSYCNYILEQEEVVAFTAGHDTRRSYSPGEQIEYSIILTNVGGGYIPGQSEFVCPITGTYVFSITSTAFGSSGNAIMELWMDDERVVVAYAANSQDPTGNALVTLQCSSGSKVFVRCTELFSCLPYGPERGISDTFAGFLLASED